MKGILELPSQGSDDLARLLLHYVDDYTRGSAWVDAATRKGGTFINDVDRRGDANALKYSHLNQGHPAEYYHHPFFRGMGLFEAAVAVSHLIEMRITGILYERGEDIGHPFLLPEFVDARIKSSL